VMLSFRRSDPAPDSTGVAYNTNYSTAPEVGPAHGQQYMENLLSASIYPTKASQRYGITL